MVHQKWHSELGHYFSEGLAKANALSTEEWSEGKWVPWLTTWSQSPFIVRRLHVEAVRHILIGLEPLILIVVNRFEVNRKLSTLPEPYGLVFTDAHISVLNHREIAREGNRRFNSKRLIVALRKIFKVRDCIQCQVFDQIVFGLFNWR
jgi:hypothetical protein